MSDLFVFIPLIIIVMLAGFIVIAMGKNSIRFVKVPHIRWFLTGYLSILIIVTVVFYFLPEDKFASIDPSELGAREPLQQEFRSTAHEGNLSETEHVYMKEKWEFSSEGKTVQVVSDSEAFDRGMVFAETKDSNDGKIEVIKYALRPTFKIDEDYEGFQVEFVDNKLKVIAPTQTSFEYPIFQNEFTITQFTGEQGGHVSIYDVLEIEVIHVRVPKGVELIGEVLYVND
ncbi:hypothetical protein NC661_07050 [Aquibacillus koreensis]|uniref:Uncharacterized protein n=1 Tax=Aquibacillus koreensis TaxID=279446 RepID=A0A9X3WI32_9BACI|nr:hypothetical protein [Aquibacillus koreensis]MCT2535590.1 hypothetical protein [Aquibacillus koreensis]MDC3420125.1 hypothetical protein [Aquibacillus koreensis]